MEKEIASKLKVLFLCTGNSCRSQMAEGWARALKGDVIEPHSAGTEIHGMNARAVKVMAEAGVDISHHRSKNVSELMDIPFDYVVTVCSHANETCPMFPGKAKIVHVAFDDPPKLARDAKTEEEALSHYRRVRDEIRKFVDQLPGALIAADTRPRKEDPMTPPQDSAILYNEAIAELVAIGAAIGANCEPCLKYHFSQARKLGATKKDIALAVAMAEAVKAAPAKAIHELAEKLSGPFPIAQEAGAPPEGACCGDKKKTTGPSCCPK